MTTDMTKDERLEQARALRGRGYNCAQCVIMSFNDITGLDDSTAARTGAALGAGVAGSGETCGVATGIAVVEGLAGGSEPADKKPAMARAKAVIDRFAAANGGCTRCRDLKRPGAPKSCDALIAEGIEMLHEALDQQPEQ